MSAREIGEALGVTARTVARDRVAMGVAQPGPRFVTPEELEHARLFLEDGCSYAEVERTFGRSYDTIKRHLPGYGWAPGVCGDNFRIHNLERRIFGNL
jgi:hypothetical protein